MQVLEAAKEEDQEKQGAGSAREELAKFASLFDVVIL
jgi:hypothetical protein